MAPDSRSDPPAPLTRYRPTAPPINVLTILTAMTESSWAFCHAGIRCDCRNCGRAIGRNWQHRTVATHAVINLNIQTSLLQWYLVLTCTKHHRNTVLSLRHARFPNWTVDYIQPPLLYLVQVWSAFTWLPAMEQIHSFLIAWLNVIWRALENTRDSVHRRRPVFWA
jgi:hypothetical protein